MNLRYKMIPLYALAIIMVAVLAIITVPKLAFADAGPGGGGGSIGCSRFDHSTCYGAVWRYYVTNSDEVHITNVNHVQPDTIVSNCGSTAGGYFAYVLPSKSIPGNVRSWQIGVPENGTNSDASTYFGGGTNYRVSSNPGDVLPATLVDGGDYGWYPVENAFAQTKSLGQNSNYQWSRNPVPGQTKTLGWFCFKNLTYVLTPSITTNSTVVESGSSVVVNPKVSNAGNGSSKSTQWQLSQFTVPSGGSYPGAGNSPSAPAAYYGNGLVRLDGGTSSYVVGDTSIGQPSEVVPDYPAGTKVCYALSVQPRSDSDNQWAHSPPTCIVVAKKPKVQVLGSDLSVGRSFLGTTAPVPKADIITNTSTKTVAGKSFTFGSWIEYGIFATGSVTGAGSASAYAGQSGASTGIATPFACDGTVLLTFNNAKTNAGCDAAVIGGYATTHSIPDVASNFPITGSTPTFNSGSIGSSKGVYTTAAASLTISGGALGKGQWVVINAPSTDVTITGDITYTSSSLGSVSDIPQLIIIARNINITDVVGRIDAWLVAKPSTTLTNGKINTCSIVADNAPLYSTICSKQLIVNGPVIANRLLLRRTTDPGAGANSGNPAEIFNLRPDAYIWTATHTTSSGRIQTVYSTELPPRL
jgi:hypothetical protein